jgi:Flp pilus assembly protein TadG
VLSWWRAGRGQVTAFVTVLVVAILVLAGLSLDGGLALAAKVTASGQAQAAARAGAQAIDVARYRATGEVVLVPAQARSAAAAFLAESGTSGTVTVAGDTVTVQITASRQTQVLALVGIRTLTVRGSGSAHIRRGVDGIEP